MYINATRRAIFVSKLSYSLPFANSYESCYCGNFRGVFMLSISAVRNHRSGAKNVRWSSGRYVRYMGYTAFSLLLLLGLWWKWCLRGVNKVCCTSTIASINQQSRAWQVTGLHLAIRRVGNRKHIQKMSLLDRNWTKPSVALLHWQIMPCDAKCSIRAWTRCSRAWEYWCWHAGVFIAPSSHPAFSRPQQQSGSQPVVP